MPTQPLLRRLAFAFFAAIFAGPIYGSDQPTWPAYEFLVRDTIINHQDASNHVRIFAEDPNNGAYVSIIPSLGRGVEDYTEQYNSTIVTHLAKAGYRVVLVQPRGIGKSSGDLTPQNITMSAFAHDLKASFDGLGIESVSLVGHAWGNRLARTFATLFPDRVDKLALMASGGSSLSEDQQKCLFGSFDLTQSDEDRTKSLQCAFFSKGNDASVWLNGWYPDLGKAETFAASMISEDFFKKAGGKPFLIIQAADDYIAPPDKAGKKLKAELGDQVSYVEIPDAGHALSSEQPDEIAKHLIKYLQE
ncbi:alpha/beta hydrolase [Halocynthiibacter sp. C4]|uniref:alpha/beta fold hydrolase n=1 Tax=Halocynthiibacter sp. C4 TaxID=2992758 RepID=UPI00237A924D|nr:alpha/beta hydrolase [Halocynthiibacter sp. C4]MDE0591435.1 alpha/beta hydrolase [Halocynthiibacter sp. C4]